MKGEMVMACTSRERFRRGVQYFGWKIVLEEITWDTIKMHTEGVDWIHVAQDRNIWELLWTRQWTVLFCKWLRISWLAERPLVLPRIYILHGVGSILQGEHFGFFMCHAFESLLCVVSNKYVFTELWSVVTSSVVRTKSFEAIWWP
jgi:hypothetical protein